MRVLSPDACGATRRHQRIHACAECHGARVLKRPQGTRALQYCDEHPLALRTECSTTPKWRNVIPSGYMHAHIYIYIYGSVLVNEMPKSARYHIDRANSIVFTSKRLPLQPVSSERNHQVPPDDSSRMKQAVVATFLR